VKSRYLVITLKTVLTIGVIGALGGLGWWLFQGEFFRITSFNCESTGFGCDQETQELFSQARGKNIFLFKKDALAETVKKQKPAFREVVIKKRLPDHLQITVSLREPFSLLIGPQGEVIVVDKEGMVLPSSQNDFSGPRLKVNSLPVIGEKVVNPDTLQGLKLIDLLQTSYIPFEYIYYPDKVSLSTQLASGVMATFSAQKELSPQVDSLQYILHHSRMGDKVIEAIDLRFQKPIITFTQK